MEADIFEEIRPIAPSGPKGRAGNDRPDPRLCSQLSDCQNARSGRRFDARVLSEAGCVEADVWAAAQDVLREEKSRVMNFDLTEESMAEGGLICGGKVEIFVEPILPIPEMIIFGAGHISTQVSKIATIAGFRTTIVD
jgi:xanthine dehydrogenase accessory factor